MTQESKPLKEYPSWHDFDINHVHYNGASVYTEDGKFYWPDLETCYFFELLTWAGKITKEGYSIPEKYKATLKKWLK